MIDYSQPIEPGIYVDPATVTENVQPGTLFVSDEAINQLNEARASFLRGDYDAALQYTNAALGLMPRDRTIHEFRGLILFALRRYPEAARTLHSVLATGPGSDWTTLIGHYPNVDVYSSQLRGLEAALEQDRNSPEVRFLLGYFYLTGGYTDAAIRQFREVVRILPNDNVAVQMIKSLEPSAAPTSVEPQPAVAQAAPPITPLSPPAPIVGVWKATAKDGTRFTLTLTSEEGFAWTFVRGGKTTTMTGTYTLNDSTLTLDEANAGPISGEVTFNADNSLTFHMADAPPGIDDLVFRR